MSSEFTFVPTLKLFSTGIILSILVLFPLGDVFANGEISEFFYEKPWSAPEAAKLKEARDLAIQLTSRAIPLLEGEDKTKAEKILIKLPQIKIAFPKPNEPMTDIICSRKNTIMRVNTNRSTRVVLICNYLLEYLDRVRTSYIAEVFIHEATHLIGFKGECTATMMESLIMDIATEKGPAKNGYHSCCAKNNWDDNKCN